MNLGMVGLGRMGGNMALRLGRRGHAVVGYSVSDADRARAEQGGTAIVLSPQELVSKLEPPRAVWLMLPPGEPTASTIDLLSEMLDRGDVVIDGGNSNFMDSIRRAAQLQARGIAFVDAGVSGGVWGLDEGYCVMLGGPAEAVERLRPVLDALAPHAGWAHMGPNGTGHFVKMVHNAIEYGLLQAFGEGFEIMRASQFDVDLARVAELWRHGSVVRSWLLDLLAQVLSREPDLAPIGGFVDDSGAGRWTVLSAIDQDVPAPVTALSLFARMASRQEESFSAKVIAAVRRELGEQPVRKGD